MHFRFQLTIVRVEGMSPPATEMPERTTSFKILRGKIRNKLSEYGFFGFLIPNISPNWFGPKSTFPLSRGQIDMGKKKLSKLSE